MKKLFLFSLLLALPGVGLSQVSMPDLDKASMAGLLQSELDVTEDQAKGGIGSVLTLAQERLDPGEFGRLTAAIPGAESYMSLAETLGAVSGPLKNMAGVTSALGKLGISPQTAAKFVPTMTDALAKIGGPGASELLKAALAAG